MCGGGRRGECDLLIPPADCDLHVALKLGRHYHAGQTAELNQIDMISFLCSACKWMIQFKRFQPLYCIDSDLLCTTTHWFCNSALRYIKEPVVRLPEHDKTRFQILQKAKNITFSLLPSSKTVSISKLWIVTNLHYTASLRWWLGSYAGQRFVIFKWHTHNAETLSCQLSRAVVSLDA